MLYELSSRETDKFYDGNAENAAQFIERAELILSVSCMERGIYGEFEEWFDLTSYYTETGDIALQKPVKLGWSSIRVKSDKEEHGTW